MHTRSAEQCTLKSWDGFMRPIAGRTLNRTSIDGVLLGISLAGQLLLLVVLMKRQLYRTFPLFCAFIAYSSLSDIGLFFLFGHISNDTAFRFYFVSDGVDILLQIGILLEIARNVMNPVKRSLPRSSLYIFGAMLATAVVATLLLSRHSPPAEVDRWAQYFVLISFTVAILRLLIFSVIAGFSQMLGIGWKNHVLQIATGLLGYSIIVLLVELLHRFSGVKDQALYHLHDQFRIISWCMVLGYWSYALSRAEATRKEFSPKMAEFLVSISQASRADETATARWYRK
jgi:hypothetical protein